MIDPKLIAEISKLEYNYVDPYTCNEDVISLLRFNGNTEDEKALELLKQNGFHLAETRHLPQINGYELIFKRESND